MIEKLDLSDTEVWCADKGYDSESLREQMSRKKLKRIFQEIKYSVK